MPLLLLVARWWPAGWLAIMVLQKAAVTSKNVSELII
jgi:hypothetical protein